MTFKKISSFLIVLFIVATIFPANVSSLSPGRALIIYPSKKYGLRYYDADRIKAYLKHFDCEADSISEKEYSPGLMGSYTYLFWLQGTGSNPAIQKDIRKTKKNAVVVGKIGNLNKNFLAKKGVHYKGRGQAKKVLYKGVLLPKKSKKFDIIDLDKKKTTKVLARIVLSNDRKRPYVTKLGNLWLVCDNPFIKATEGAHYLVFADILHDIIKNHHHQRKAVIRIDGIDPKSDPQKLSTIFEFLYFNGMPFAMSVTPVYKASKNSKPIKLSQKPALVKVLRKAVQKRGGVVILNGYSHQRTGKTKKDLEFGANAKKANPSSAQRVRLGMNEMKKCGLVAKIWQTPFYQATYEEKEMFSYNFKYVFERGTEPPLPYRVTDNAFGQKIIPENLGFVSFGKKHPKETIEARAWRMQVVRDAYAGFSIEEGILENRLVKIIKDLQDYGYTFQSPYKAVGLKYKPPTQPFLIDRIIYEISSKTDDVVKNIGWLMMPIVFIGFYIAIFGLSRKIKPRPKEEDRRYFFVILVPALNEEEVIRGTLENLVSLSDKNYMVIAINDNSQDRTLREMEAVRSKKLTIFNIDPLESQQGKGRALNKAYRYLLDELEVTNKYSADRIIVGIVDSDGRVERGIIPSVTPYFKDKRTASVQTGVRIGNWNENILTKWQEFEFRVFTFMFQSAREQLGSVGLGGNGQFIRLSALMHFGRDPWTDCLTEDLDIGIRLILDDYVNHFCPTSYVIQQGIPRFWPLVRQRTRWFHGHLQCWRHLGRLSLKRLPILAKLDIAYYLLVISLALVVIPANFFMAFQASYLLANHSFLAFLTRIFGTKIFIYWYFGFFGAMPIMTYVYWRAKKQSLLRATVLSHAFIFVSVVWLIAGYRALFRLCRRKRSWYKTERYSKGSDSSEITEKIA